MTRSFAYGKAGQVMLVPYIIKTDLFGPDSEKHRIPSELGRLLVPERRDNPESNLIELTFVRLQSTAKKPGPPLIFLAGGPGISGIDSLRWDILYPWFHALTSVGDVIALDQRGTGRSIPCLDCIERWNLPIEEPGIRENMLAVAHERSQTAIAFWQEQNVDLTGYTTVESADDINDLRRALGYETINLYGASYGSHLALATIRRHSEHIAHAIIAMVEGPDHTIKLPGNIQKHLIDLNQLIQADDRLNKQIPDFLQLMQNVFQRLENQPVQVEFTQPHAEKKSLVGISKFDLQLLTASGIGSRRFIAGLPARYYAMEQGDFAWAANKIAERRNTWFGSAMSYMMDCASGVSKERYIQVQREAPQTLLEDMINFPFPEISDAWGNPDLGDAFRTPIISNVPALFLSGSLDGRTPIVNAQEVQAGFASSHHIFIEGAAHSTAEFVTAPGITEAIVSFLQDLPVPRTQSAIPFEFTPIK